MIGQVLGHYKIIDQVGAGGMGVVYRAHDEQLDRYVAVKVLPAGVLADEGTRKRFRQEALALAKLNHPNIETVHQFGSQDGVDFLVMELISGVPLNEKLKSGPLSERDVMRLGMQLADGLTAAHECGVVHSDLKPANIFITADNRLKILDFGLARLLKSGDDNDLTQTITAESGPMAGTLPYMSPEQLRGEPTDPRSDIYAAGTVLYEMATGTRPFPQHQTASLIGAILHAEPPPLRTLNEQIQPSVEGVILKALDKSPASRYQTAREFRAALETLTTSNFASSRSATEQAHVSNSATGAQDAPRTTTIVIPQQVTRSVMVGGGIVIVAILAAGIVLGFDIGGARSKIFHSTGADTRLTPSGETVPTTRRAVAVLSLVNSSKQPDQAWLSTELQEMLATELGAGGNVRVISGEEVARMKSDLALPDGTSYGPETLARIQKVLDADDVVTGSYLAPGNGDLRLDLRLQDARSGETIAPVSVTGKSGQASDLVDAVTRAGVELRERMGLEGRPPGAEALLKASTPTSPAAARLYAEGIDKLRAFDAMGAVDPLHKAIKEEPGYALAHSALAEAWSALGYDQRAKEEDAIALPLAKSLSAEDQGMIQGRLYEFSSQWDKAATYYLSLRTLYQGDIDYGLRQANAQIRGGKPQDALTTLSELRATPAAAGQDPRIDLSEADAAEMMGDFKRQEAAASRAAEKATAQGMRRVAADADWHWCTAQVNLGDAAAAKSACEKARDSAKAVQDPLLEARSLTGLGNALENAGDVTQALEYHKQALQLVRGIGAQRDIAGALLNIAGLMYASGDLKGAHGYYQDSLATSRQINNKQGIVDAEGGLAADLYASGEYGAAQPIYEDMLKTAREIPDQKNAAIALNSLGLVAFQLGDLRSARKYIQDSLNAAHEAHMDADYAGWLCSLGDVELAEDQLDAAEKTYEESRRLNQQLKEPSGLAQDDASVANLALERNEPRKSEGLARQAADAFHTQKNADSEVDALNTLVRALIAENNLAEACKALDRGNALPAQDQAIRLAFATTGARLQALEGQPTQALQSLDDLGQKAKQMKLKKQELEVRLAKAAIEWASGRKSSAQAELKSVQAEASAAGFRSIARRAGEFAKTGNAASS
jgi:serine/threonine protein kinase/Tfp pilus assembly protein PilF/TolB-like protein